MKFSHSLKPSLLSKFQTLSLPYLLVAPTVAVLLALSIYPLIFAVKTGLQNKSGEWTMENLTRLVTDQFFFAALLHTFIYAALALTCEFLFGLGLALLLDRGLRGRSFFRAIMLVPMMLPPVVVGVVWRLMYNADFGAINGTLKIFGFNTEAYI